MAESMPLPDVVARVTLDFGTGFGRPQTWGIQRPEVRDLIEQAISIKASLQKRSKAAVRVSREKALQKCVKAFQGYCDGRPNLNDRFVREIKFAMGDLSCKMMLHEDTPPDAKGKVEVPVKVITMGRPAEPRRLAVQAQ